MLRFDTNLVNVFFTAVDKNKRFVTTLGQQDMRVMEDGVPREVFTFQRETERPLLIAVLIDVSISQQHTLPVEKAAAQTFVNTVIRPGKDWVAVISFTGDATLEQGFTSSSALLQQAIERVEVVFPPGYVGGGIVIGVPSANDQDQRVVEQLATTTGGTSFVLDKLEDLDAYFVASPQSCALSICCSTTQKVKCRTGRSCL